jgi:hypothetical protein
VSSWCGTANIGTSISPRLPPHHQGVDHLAHLLRLLRVEGGRLLAEDVLARPRGLDVPLGVERVGERVVDDVDLGVVDDVLVATARAPMTAAASITLRGVIRDAPRMPMRIPGLRSPARRR